MRLPKETDELLEPFLDEATDKLAREIFKEGLPEIAKDTPVIKWGMVGYDLYTLHKMKKLKKRMIAFLRGLEAGSFSIDEFEKLDDQNKEMIIETLINELDLQNDDYQAEALALLFNAYIKKEIDRLMFIGVAHELKNTNPLTFYFNVDSIVVKGEDDDMRVVSGPIHNLPAAFVSDSNEKFQMSSDSLLTNMGRVFYVVIYRPMQEKYSI